MQLFACEQPPADPPAEGGICEIVQDENRLEHPPELTHRTVKVVPWPTGEQPFEGNRRGRLAGRKGGEELTHAIPVRGDPIEMQGALFLTDERGERSIGLLRVDAVNPLAMQAPNTRAKALAKH